MSRFQQLRNKIGWKFLNQQLLTSAYRCNRFHGTLAFEEIRSSPTAPSNFTAFVLHGLLGSGRNWRSFSRTLASSLPEWRMVPVDLRNHGKSVDRIDLLPPHDMAHAADDLFNLVNSQGWDWPDVVIGHSMGGKVALQFAQSCARGDYGQSARLPKQHHLSFCQGASVKYWMPMTAKFWHKTYHIMRRKNSFELWRKSFILLFTVSVGVFEYVVDTTDAEQLWVLDSVPGKVSSDNSDGEVEKVLETLQSLPSSIPSRKWLVDHMMELGFSKVLSEWLGSNLKKSGDQVTWGFNLEGALEMFRSYRETDYWPLLEKPPKGLEIAIVRAENSDRWTRDDIERLEFLDSRTSDDEDVGKVSYYVLPKSGHWVHVDNPKGLLEIVTPKITTLV